jgi:hypothetical protein
VGVIVAIVIVNLVFCIWLLRRRRRARERAMGPVPMLEVQQPVYEVTEAQKPQLYAVDSESKLSTAPPEYAYQLCYAAPNNAAVPANARGPMGVQPYCVPPIAVPQAYGVSPTNTGQTYGALPTIPAPQPCGAPPMSPNANSNANTNINSSHA